MRNKTIFGLMLLLLCACTGPFTQRERLIIGRSQVPMYVTTVEADSAFLRTPSADFGPAELASPLLDTLISMMMGTLRHPSQDGVGIAAPQVGISRRIIIVKRYDKSDGPFEVFVNVKIDSLLGAVVCGPEGCLSVPGLRGMVPRHEQVVVSYYDRALGKRVSELVDGYTAIIFQHECDHLDGILYTDRADTVFVNEAWLEERAAFDYSKPEWW